MPDHLLSALRLTIAALLAALPIVSSAQDINSVMIGNTVKKTAGTIQQLDNGDTACYITLKDDQGIVFEELGAFDICTEEPTLVGRRVRLRYSEENVLADECNGNPDCTESRKVALVIEAQITDAP